MIMLRIDNMNYNSSATSVDNNDNVLANMNFSADNYSNYYFNINFSDAVNLTNTTVDDDFVEFKQRAAAIIAANSAPINNPTNL